MNLQKRIAFEAWCKPLGYDLAKVPAMLNENPYVDSGTWKAYEAWCAGARFAHNRALSNDDTGYDA